jgi:predicted GTPase
MKYYPGEVNLRISDVVIINKIDSARPKDVAKVRSILSEVIPNTTVIDAASPVSVEHPELIKNKKVLVIEDGPTLTHGGMKIGAGTVAAQIFGVSEIIDPRPYLVGKLKETFEIYPEIGAILPAMGYGEAQLRDLELTINACDCEAVVIGTPIDLNRVIKINKPSTRVFYDLQSIGEPSFESVIEEFLVKKGITKGLGELV